MYATLSFTRRERERLPGPFFLVPRVKAGKDDCRTQKTVISFIILKEEEEEKKRDMAELLHLLCWRENV